MYRFVVHITVFCANPLCV